MDMTSEYKLSRADVDSIKDTWFHAFNQEELTDEQVGEEFMKFPEWLKLRIYACGASDSEVRHDIINYWFQPSHDAEGRHWDNLATHNERFSHD